jgi:hypothetical protein
VPNTAQWSLSFPSPTITSPLLSSHHAFPFPSPALPPPLLSHRFDLTQLTQPSSSWFVCGQSPNAPSFSVAVSVWTLGSPAAA